ncbi:MFS transporter [Caballeronia sp. dw_19]|uniref:MFS transporter n=1 Tax=Caballeronia sp. dw_19 TaxID=2719791 RepID=UPI001BD326A7|nr:MFS transporter [Caballeronia sp. dw_19]
MQTSVCDISDVVEQQKIGRFAVSLVACIWFVMLIEGYDLAALAYAAPALSKAWHLGRGALGPAFGANVPGIMIGSFLFGYLGDRFGRKPTIILGALVFGTMTLATIWAPGVEGLIALRLLAGIGLGGAIPNAVVLLSESAPRRLRATWISLSYTGYMMGAGLGGVVSAGLVHRFGWHVVFFIGGVAPLVIAVGLALLLPESLRHLVVKEREPRRIAHIAKQIQPDLDVDETTRFIVSDEFKPVRFSVRLLFGGRLRYVTPVLWLTYIANSMTLLFLQNWLPMLIESIGVRPGQAALVAAMFSVGGAAGGLALMRFIDDRGPGVITCLPVIGIPFVALLGVPMPESTLIFAVFGVGFCVVGTQFGLNAVSAMVYPTAFRSKGTGAALAIAKIGSFLGPVIGGMLLAANVPVAQLFYVAAVPVLIVAVLAATLGWLYRDRSKQADFAKFSDDIQTIRH